MFVFDGAHNDGNEFFYFLPPLVSYPEVWGVFDYELEPMVKIMEDVTELASFEMGEGSDHIRVDMEDEHYIANWQMKGYAFDSSKIYRISVWLMAEEIGYIEMDFGEMERVVTVNRTIPIKFRIEEGVLDVTITPAAGPIATSFTIYDPQGRMADGDIVMFYEDGQDPATEGTPAESVRVSEDGKMLTGNVPAGLNEDTMHYVTVHEPILLALRFDPLEFMVSE